MPRALLLLPFLLLVSDPGAQVLPAWETHHWDVVCDDVSQVGSLHTCNDDSAVSAAAFVRAQLEAFSPWIQGLGFPGPTVPLDPTRPAYVALIGGDSVRVDGETVCGYYNKSQQGGRLVVGALTTFQLEGESDETGTAGHEAFHAIQGSYPAYDSRTASHAWIVEGTAQAVEAAWLRHDQGRRVLGEGGTAYLYGFRHYDDPLHQPEANNTDQLYATSHFWLALGNLLRTRDHIEYLDDVIAAIGAPGAGLAVVDDALGASGGLHRMYPRVIAEHAQDPEHFGRKMRFQVPPEYENTRAFDIGPVATSYFQIDVPDVGSSGVAVEVEIPDEPYLHLLVDGEIRDGEDPTDETPRSQARVVLDSPGHVIVQVANVSPDAEATTAQTYDLTVRTRPLAGCDSEAEGQGVAACLAFSGPQYGGVHHLVAEARGPSALMRTSGIVRVVDTRNGRGATIMSPTFGLSQMGTRSRITIQHTVLAETGRQTFDLNLDPADGTIWASLSTDELGTIGIDGLQLVVAETVEGQVLRGRFTGRFGGCNEVPSGPPECVRHTSTNEIIEEHGVTGTFSIRLPEDD